MRVFMIGDIVGTGVLRALAKGLPHFCRQHGVDIVIANGENAAQGLGLTQSIASKIHNLGVSLITLGNHTFAKREFVDQIDYLPYVIRPVNGAHSWPGCGYTVIDHPKGRLLVLNLLGMGTLSPSVCPFEYMHLHWDRIRTEAGTKLAIVDFHAEYTSEKRAMALMLDGRASLVVGTHTHVQTADEMILPRGTGFISDLGMTGPAEGVLGMDADCAIKRFLEHIPERYALQQEGSQQLNGIMADLDPITGRCCHIERVQMRALDWESLY